MKGYIFLKLIISLIFLSILSSNTYALTSAQIKSNLEKKKAAELSKRIYLLHVKPSTYPCDFADQDGNCFCTSFKCRQEAKKRAKLPLK